MILRKEREEDEELLCLAAYVVKQGKYDENILAYLRDSYYGSLESMCALWKKVKGFQLESYVLDERILTMAMFVRSFPSLEAEILGSYISQHGREDLIQAYLAAVSGAYFLQGRETSEDIFRWLEKICQWGWNTEEVCKLALLKRYSRLPELKENQEKNGQDLLEEFRGKGLRFAFYQDLPGTLTQACQIEDKVFCGGIFPGGGPGGDPLPAFRTERGAGGVVCGAHEKHVSGNLCERIPAVLRRNPHLLFQCDRTRGDP